MKNQILIEALTYALASGVSFDIDDNADKIIEEEITLLQEKVNNPEQEQKRSKYLITALDDALGNGDLFYGETEEEDLEGFSIVEQERENLTNNL